MLDPEPVLKRLSLVADARTANMCIVDDVVEMVYEVLGTGSRFLQQTALCFCDNDVAWFSRNLHYGIRGSDNISISICKMRTVHSQPRTALLEPSNEKSSSKSGSNSFSTTKDNRHKSEDAKKESFIMKKVKKHKVAAAAAASTALAGAMMIGVFIQRQRENPKNQINELRKESDTQSLNPQQPEPDPSPDALEADSHDSTEHASSASASSASGKSHSD